MSEKDNIEERLTNIAEVVNKHSKLLRKHNSDIKLLEQKLSAIYIMLKNNQNPESDLYNTLFGGLK